MCPCSALSRPNEGRADRLICAIVRTGDRPMARKKAEKPERKQSLDWNHSAHEVFSVVDDPKRSSTQPHAVRSTHRGIVRRFTDKSEAEKFAQAETARCAAKKKSRGAKTE